MDREITTSTPMRSLNIIMLWLFLVTVMLLVTPWEMISSDIAVRIEENRAFLYFALIFEVSNFLSQAVYSFLTKSREKKVAEKRTCYLEKAVESLDFSERALLREYVLQRKSVLNLPLAEPTVKALLDCGILKCVGNEDEHKKTPVIISKYARPFITYRAIGLSCGKMSEEQISQIMDARPEFAREPKQTPRSYRGSRKVA